MKLSSITYRSFARLVKTRTIKTPATIALKQNAIKDDIIDTDEDVLRLMQEEGLPYDKEWA